MPSNTKTMGLTPRARQLRSEIRQALDQGADRARVAEVVRAFSSGERVEPDELRNELAKLVPQEALRTAAELEYIPAERRRRGGAA